MLMLCLVILGPPQERAPRVQGLEVSVDPDPRPRTRLHPALCGTRFPAVWRTGGSPVSSLRRLSRAAIRRARGGPVGDTRWLETPAGRGPAHARSAPAPPPSNRSPPCEPRGPRCDRIGCSEEASIRYESLQCSESQRVASRSTPTAAAQRPAPPRAPAAPAADRRAPGGPP